MKPDLSALDAVCLGPGPTLMVCKVCDWEGAMADALKSRGRCPHELEPWHKADELLCTMGIRGHGGPTNKESVE